METVTVVYHFEDGSWWVEAPGVPEFVGGADTFEDARVRAREGLAFVLEHEVELDERFDEPAMAARRGSTTLHVSGFGNVTVRDSTGSYTPTPARPDRTRPTPPRALSVASSSA